MAVYIREYADIGVTNSRVLQAGAEPAAVAADQKLTNAAGSVASAAFSEFTRIVCVHTDSIISITFGMTAPTATTGHLRMAADTTTYFGVRPGMFLAVIDNA